MPEDIEAEASNQQQNAGRMPPLSLSLSPFLRDNPPLSFSINENLMDVHKISDQKARFALLCRSLPSQMQLELAGEISRAQSRTDCYEALKKDIIDRYNIPESVRMSALLSQTLGTRTPVEFLSTLRQQQGTAAEPDNIYLKNILLNSLPPPVRAILATNQTEDLDELARAATRIMQAAQPSSAIPISAVQPTWQPEAGTPQLALPAPVRATNRTTGIAETLHTDIAAMQLDSNARTRSGLETVREELTAISAKISRQTRMIEETEGTLQQQLARIERRVTAVENELEQRIRPGRGVYIDKDDRRQRSQSRGRTHQDPYLCYYHEKFGEQAFRCGQNGCTWQYNDRLRAANNPTGQGHRGNNSQAAANQHQSLN